MPHLPAGDSVLRQSPAPAAALSGGEQRVLAVLVGATGGEPQARPAVHLFADLVGGARGRVLGRRRRPRGLAHVFQSVAASRPARADAGDLSAGLCRRRRGCELGRLSREHVSTDSALGVGRVRRAVPGAARSAGAEYSVAFARRAGGLVRQGAPGLAFALVPADARWAVAAALEPRVRADSAGPVADRGVLDAARAVLAFNGPGDSGGCAAQMAVAW